jgi:serine/threonine-protein kinase
MASDGVTANAPQSAPPDPLIGRVIAERFRITSLIARGGMGKVYKAEQSPLGRVCAVKVLNPNYTGDADPEFHRRFFREASITARITHPNSITIFDYGKTDDDIYYMVMEFLAGQTLHLALRECKTMPEERVGRIAQQMCRALREAHALDVIHRDLKPANIFLTRHGDEEDFVKVLDFGLVKHLAELPEEQLTQTGLFMGSPKYMAPEQIQGGHVDARTDIYSLGIMMYEMLAGRAPFERATSVNILMAHVGEPPPPMREVNPNLVCSPAFEELVMRCIAKNPADRFASMDEVLQGIKFAHGSSQTGQVVAMHSSGVYIPVATVPPPSLHSNAPGFASAQTTGPSTTHTPLSTPNLSPSSMSTAVPARRSRMWSIGGGIVAAAIVGSALGMLAFRMISTEDGGGVAVPSVLPTAQPVGAAPKVETPPPVDARTATVNISTEPTGATVREDGAERCAATPCDITFRGDEADPAKVHRLLISHAGFRPETRSIKVSDSPISLKLVRIGGGPPAHAVPPAASPTKPPAEASPSGFKELPY